MVSTLIVRDVTLAVNGAPETRGELGAHIRSRIEAVASFEQAAVEECVEVLLPHASGETCDPEVQQSLFLLSLGHPETCARLGVNEIQFGRELAAELEESDRVEDAADVLEVLSQRHPGQRAIERDLAGLMRRRGMVDDLAERYTARAAQLTKVGKVGEAIDCLREVLLLDRSRKDIARMIRDLRYQETDERKKRKRRTRKALTALALSTVVTFVFIHELQVTRAYNVMPASQMGNLPAMQARLSAMDAFVAVNPVWYRAIFVQQERSELKIAVDRLSSAQLRKAEAVHLKVAQRLEAANLARERGLIRAGSGDYESALAEFEQSLQLANASWPPRGRVERDIEAIMAWLEEQR